MIPAELLTHLREKGVEVTPEDGQLRVRGPQGVLTDELTAALRDHRDELRMFLRAEDALDLRPAKPGSIYPDLSRTDPATVEQVRRLRDLANDPAWGDDRPTVQRVVGEAIRDGLTEAGAYGLIREVGARLQGRKSEEEVRDRRPEGEL